MRRTQTILLSKEDIKVLISANLNIKKADYGQNVLKDFFGEVLLQKIGLFIN
uniref:hypothetical protein n=1 Tax=Clostridium paraputrificum TaxID=29363 RepID=UPI003BAC8A1A